MKITVVVDNQENIAPFLPEFGLSLLLETEKETYLFDTGAGRALLPNLRQLNVAPDSIRNVILSHGHYDHTGGLAGLAPENIFCCPDVTQPHFSRHEDGSVHCLTMPEGSRKVLKHCRIHEINGFQQIAPGIFLTGPIPRVSGEDCGGDFYCDESCHRKDTVPDEQALLTSDGVLVTGCCHAGIINTIAYCHDIHPEIQIHTVIGGLHLRHADDDRLTRTADFLKQNHIRQLYPLHCTGENAVNFLLETMYCTVSLLRPGAGTAFYGIAHGLPV